MTIYARDVMIYLYKIFGGHLGGLLHSRGRLQEAEEVLRRVLRERQELQPLHLETLATQCALAAVLRDAGDLEASYENCKV